MSFPPHFLETLRTRVSLADVVGKRVIYDRRKSNPRRRDYWGCCPFHGEKTPSFHVDDAKGFYHCFGCGVSGDAISFVQQIENVSFAEAVERLAAEAGLAVPQQDPREARRQEARRSLGEVLELAQRHFVVALAGSAGEAARAYLAGRQCSPALQRTFEIGYAPAGRTSLFDALTRQGVDGDLMAQAGLVSFAEGRQPLDRFRDRIMFPIRDARERLVGFGGRILTQGSDAPKYLNSPETALFDKGRLLFNHARARKALRETGTLVVVEGYMDVIALHGAGLVHAVAPLGTALTEDQLALLWRETAEPILCFDGDMAGQRAASRALDLALPHVAAGRSLRFVLLPDGQDPDDLARRGGKAALEAILGAPVALVDLLFERERAAAPYDTPERRADLERRLLGAARRISDPGVRTHYERALRERLRALFTPPPMGAYAAQRRGQEGGGRRGIARPMARMEGVSPFLKRNLLAQEALRIPARGSVCGVDPAQVRSLVETLEACLLLVLVEHPELIERVAETLAQIHFVSRKLDKIANELIHLVSDGGLDTQALRDHLKTFDIHGAVSDVAGRSFLQQRSASWAGQSPSDCEQLFCGFAARHDRAVKLRVEIEEAQAAAIGEDPEAERHLLRLKALLAERRSLEMEQFGPRDDMSLTSGRIEIE